MLTFKALRIHNIDKQIQPRYETVSLADLTQGEIIIRCHYSCINYKDALAATGKGKILRQYPLVGGIDVAGIVVESSDPRLKAGDPVVAVGGGLSECYDGGYAEYARLPVEITVPLPSGLTLRETMAIGTAGFTAAFAIDRLLHNGQHPELGSIIVTGASGGVGSIAIDLLTRAGFHVTALTSKESQRDYLQSLGAKDILLFNQIPNATRPLENAQWGGAIDNIGGDVLSWLTRTVKPCGNIAAIGLAGGTTLNTTVMPFILRGINLLGINSIEVTRETRERIWQRLGADLKPQHLDFIAQREIGFDELLNLFPAYIDNTISGRTIVNLNR